MKLICEHEFRTSVNSSRTNRCVSGTIYIEEFKTVYHLHFKIDGYAFPSVSDVVYRKRYFSSMRDVVDTFRVLVSKTI